VTPPAHSQEPDRVYQWAVLWVVMLGTFMSVLDSSIVNVSLPTMMGDFGVDVDDIEWVATGYMLAFATLMPLTGWLRDHIGGKRLYSASLMVFVLGSVACGLSWNMPSMITARVFQALGGGAIVPTGMAMISDVFPPRERGKAMGIWGMGLLVAPALGPTLGGWMTHHMGWRSIFWVNVPVGAVGLLMAMAMLRPDPPHPEGRRSFDFWGFLFFSSFLVAFLLGLSNGESKGWHSPYIYTCWGISAFGLAAFLVVESLVKDQIIDLSLFKSPVFSICILVSVVRSVALFGGLFLLPVFVQRVQGLDAVDAGLLMLPGSILMAILMPFAGSLADKVGARWPAVVGMICLVVFMYMYRNIDVNTSRWGIILPTMVRSLGMPLLMAPIMAALLNAVPTRKGAQASSINAIAQQVGGSLGISLLTSVLTHRTHFHLADMGEVMSGSSPVLRGSLAGLAQRAHELGLTHAQSQAVASGALAGHVAQSASVAGFQDAFLVATAIVLVALFTAFFLPDKPAHHVQDVEVILE
jgi:DHA2 family multidrug resistance protein